MKKSKELALKRKLGDPFDSTVVQGPQVDKKIFDRALNYIKIGKESGAKLEAGGERLGTVGYYIKVYYKHLKINFNIKIKLI